MTDSQLVQFYARAVGEHPPCKPTDDELGAWQKTLTPFGGPQLDAALRRWLVDTRIEDWTQKPVGSRMPTATELKLSIENFERAEQAARTGKFSACNRNGCVNGWLKVFEGKTVAGNAVDHKVGAVHRCVCWLQYIVRVKGAVA